MDKELLKEILSIPTHSRKEDLVRDFLISWGIRNGITVRLDVKGNVYLHKGTLDEGESYPCVVAHMDTVHFDQSEMIDNNERIIIVEDELDGNEILSGRMPNGNLTGCGGDDKAGIFIALQLIEKFDKIVGVFFVEEEIGCLGSKESYEEWLKDVGYFIQFDAPTDNWISRVCSGVVLFNEDMHGKLKPIWDKHDQSNIRTNDPFTDVKELKKKFPVCCINYFAGYMNMHTSSEFVVVDYVEKAIKLAEDTIKELGCNKYEFEHVNI